jgi:hypothetical protein
MTIPNLWERPVDRSGKWGWAYWPDKAQEALAKLQEIFPTDHINGPGRLTGDHPWENKNPQQKPDVS